MFKSPVGSAAASSFQSQGKMALRETLGSLEVSSRREDWNITLSVGICLASRCDDLLSVY